MKFHAAHLLEGGGVAITTVIEPWSIEALSACVFVSAIAAHTAVPGRVFPEFAGIRKSPDLSQFSMVDDTALC